MARPLTPPEREEYGARAYEMAIKGMSQRRIGEILNLHHSTVGRILKEQIALRRAERRDSAHSLLDQLDAGIAEAWRRLEALPASSASPAGAALLNSLNSLLKNKVSILGLAAPVKSQSWVHHTTERMEATLDKLPESEQREYVRILERICALVEDDGEPEAHEQNGTSLRQISPSRNPGELA